MDVAAQILAEMALNPTQEPTCHFMRMPLELRKRVYTLLLLPPPVPRIHCSITPHSKQCSPGGRFLASTCKPKPNVIRTIDCGTCEWRGADVHTAILCTNRAIHAEAFDVLYENSQAICFSVGPSTLPSSDHIRFRLRRFVFVVRDDSPRAVDYDWREFPDVYPNLKVVELHFDVDLTKMEHQHLNAEGFGSLTRFNELEVVVDVHIVCAWDGDDDWKEPIARRESITHVRALELDDKAQEMRLEFIGDLGEVFKVAGKTLVIRDN